MKRALFLLVLAACPKSETPPKTTDTPAKRDAGTGAHLLTPDDGATAVQLPPAPPLPEVPAGLPARPALDGVTPELVALGELLFHDARLSRSGKTACTTCHDPAHGFAGKGRQPTDDGKSNLRRAPALVNLAWVTAYGWDGRYPSVRELLPPHAKGQLGQPVAESLSKIADLPLYRAHLARVGGDPIEATLGALAAYVVTRYAGDAPWDRVEPTARVPKPGAAVDPVVAGYLVFTGKGQCAVCHPPPLYTNGGFHRVIVDQYDDPGRGVVDKTQAGAFRTPSLRGARMRPSFMHTGHLSSLEAVVESYATIGQTVDDLHVDAALTKINLAPQDKTHLLAFLAALTAPAKPVAPPALP